uniref:Uncharacterized protein n=1 Tax=Romanomermis culicivorax TaxID=13658 RepID=A0A915HM38_ROMCU
MDIRVPISWWMLDLFDIKTSQDVASNIWFCINHQCVSQIAAFHIDLFIDVFEEIIFFVKIIYEESATSLKRDYLARNLSIIQSVGMLQEKGHSMIVRQ